MEWIISTQKQSIIDFFVLARKNAALCTRYFLKTKHKPEKISVFQSKCKSQKYGQI